MDIGEWLFGLLGICVGFRGIPGVGFMEFAWVFGYMCDVISAMSRKLFPLFVVAIGWIF